jgi:hypothetical protein
MGLVMYIVCSVLRTSSPPPNTKSCTDITGGQNKVSETISLVIIVICLSYTRLEYTQLILHEPSLSFVMSIRLQCCSWPIIRSLHACIQLSRRSPDTQCPSSQVPNQSNMSGRRARECELAAMYFWLFYTPKKKVVLYIGRLCFVWLMDKEPYHQEALLRLPLPAPDADLPRASSIS